MHASLKLISHVRIYLFYVRLFSLSPRIAYIFIKFVYQFQKKTGLFLLTLEMAQNKKPKCCLYLFVCEQFLLLLSE